MAATVTGPRSQLPNALTIGRILAIPAYVVLLLQSEHGYSWAAALVFGGAAITDQIDGFLARRWHVESAFGKIADPLADRILIDCAIVLLWHAGRLPAAALLILVRDVVLVGATPLMLGRGYRFEVNAIGKLATWLLYMSLGLAMVVHASEWPRGIFWVGFALALVSLALYARSARQEMRGWRDAEAAAPGATHDRDASSPGGAADNRLSDP